MPKSDSAAPSPPPAPSRDTNLFWEERGNGEPILFIHAGVADSRMWEPQVSAFSDSYRVIRYDWRGAGRSQQASEQYTHFDDAVAVLDAANVDRAHLIGISKGGTIALETALAHPQRVHSLVIGGSSPQGLVDHTNLLPSFERIDALIAEGDIDAANELELQMWVDGPVRPLDEVDPAVRALVGEMNRALLASTWEGAPRPLDPPASARLDEVSVPTLILAGEYDQPSSIAGPMLLSEQIPGAEYHLLPGVAHMMNMERAEQFNEIVREFLARHPIRPAAG